MKGSSSINPQATTSKGKQTKIKKQIVIISKRQYNLAKNFKVKKGIKDSVNNNAVPSEKPVKVLVHSEYNTHSKINFTDGSNKSKSKDAQNQTAKTRTISVTTVIDKDLLEKELITFDKIIDKFD